MLAGTDCLLFFLVLGRSRKPDPDRQRGLPTYAADVIYIVGDCQSMPRPDMKKVGLMSGAPRSAIQKQRGAVRVRRTAPLLLSVSFQPIGLVFETCRLVPQLLVEPDVRPSLTLFVMSRGSLSSIAFQPRLPVVSTVSGRHYDAGCQLQELSRRGLLSFYQQR